MPEASNWVKVSQTMADMPKVVALMPLGAQGETADRPSPVPKISKIRDSAAAAIAPAKTAAQDTALKDEERPLTSSVAGLKLTEFAAAIAALEFMINPQKLGEEIMKHRLYKKGKPDLQASVGEFRVAN